MELIYMGILFAGASAVFVKGRIPERVKTFLTPSRRARIRTDLLVRHSLQITDREVKIPFDSGRSKGEEFPPLW